MNGHKSEVDPVAQIVTQHEIDLERTERALRHAVRIIAVLLLIVGAFFYGAFLAPVPVSGFIVILIGCALGLLLIVSDRRNP